MSDKASGRTVGQGSTMLETLYGSLSGMAFGLVSPLASQPFDTLKTKMQAESRFASQSMGSGPGSPPRLSTSTTPSSPT